MEQKRLDAIRARAEAATKEPWALIKSGRYEDHDECRIDLTDDTIELSRYENGEFVAAARTDVPDLLDEVARLTAELAAMTADRDAWKARAEAAEQDLNALRKRSGWKCYACHYDNHSDRDVCVGCGYNDGNNWRWRGPVEGGEGV